MNGFRQIHPAGIILIAFMIIGGARSETIPVNPADLAADGTIFEIAAHGHMIWTGHEQCLYFSDNGGLSWNRYDTANGFGRGVVTAMTVNDSAFWATTYYDTVINGFDFYVNGGIYTSSLQSMNWEYIDVPGRLDAGNITYDIELNGTTVWTANWWAGLKKSIDGGQTWELVVPDTGFFNPIEMFHHRVFSVATRDAIIWAGSERGLNLSRDGGQTWQTLFNEQDQPSPAADKIAALSFRETIGMEEIWAACWATIHSGGTNGISISSDTGLTWRTVLIDQKAWDFLFHDNDIFVACNTGLWYSGNNGDDFTNLTASHLSPDIEIYDVEMTADSFLWIGTSAGLYRGSYFGEWWEKVDFISLDAIQAEEIRPKTFELGQNFPNPFNPMTTIPVNLEKSELVTLRVFDILGRPQKTIISAALPAGNHSLVWDGLDDNGRELPSGVYFYRLETEQIQSTRKMILLR